MKRKDFIRLAGPAIILLANGRIAKATQYWESESRRWKILFRFAVASDGHYGEPGTFTLSNGRTGAPGTDYQNYFAALVSAINEDHDRDPFTFMVVNGDIVHDDKSHYPAAKLALDGLSCKYYVSQGNHDKVTAAEWESIWGMPVNFDFTHKKKAFLIGATSDERGEYLCPDLNWFTQKLEEHRNKQVYIFVHINPAALTPNAKDC
ncbi:MAG: metallophosphoesterase, partial [Flavitalea sp.]